MCSPIFILAQQRVKRVIKSICTYQQKVILLGNSMSFKFYYCTAFDDSLLVNCRQLIQFIMKKAKPENTNTTYSLAAKRASLNQDKLHLGYKADWDPNLLQNMDNKSNSNKAFFQNMKEQLSTIKNDFQKLLKKESSFNSANKANREQINIASYQTIGAAIKGKSMSSYKKEDKKAFFQNFEQPKRYEMMPQKESVNDIISNKLFNTQKNASFSQKKQLYSQNAQTKEKDYYSNHISAKTSSNKYSQHSQPLTQQSYKLALAGNRDTKTPVEKEFYEKIERSNAEREKQNLRLKQLVAKLNEQIAIYKKDRQALRSEYQKATAQKQLYMSKLTELSKELNAKMNYASLQEQKIKELNEQLKNKDKQLGLVNEKSQEIDKQRAFYTETINELRFHNENFHNINCELGMQNERLKENVNNMQNYIQHLNMIKENTQNDFKRKLEFNKRDIEQYQKREAMFTKQIQRLSQMLHNTISSEHTQVHTEEKKSSSSEVQVLQQKIAELTQQVQLQRQINATLTEKYEQNLKKMNIFELKQNFQAKINSYIDENTKLKSIINNLKAQNQSLNEQNRSYLQEIKLYQERQKNIKANKKLTSSQWQELIQEIQRLKVQNRSLLQKLQLKQLKAQIIEIENALQFQVAPHQSIIKMVHNQLNQIENLKEMITGLQKQNQILSNQIFLRGQNSLKHNPSSQSKIILALKDLIFKILVKKIDKEQCESDAEFFLRRVQQLKPFLLNEAN